MMGYLCLILQYFAICCFCLVHSIKVTFGTNQGSITPLYQTTPAQPRQLNQEPAPVFEATDDIPNPYTYRPPIPHQYRTKLFSYKPKPDLVLGTAVDQKYTPGYEKFGPYYKEYRDLGREYTGPQFFEKQPYEKYVFKKFKTVPKGDYYRDDQKQYYRGKYVPEIGIVYSAGVRYYVPQVKYYEQEQEQEQEQENSVYGNSDVDEVYYRPS